MNHYELFVSQSNIFSGFQKPFEKADYIVLGVPFDVTSTYRTGARFGPNAIRQASLNIETYSFRTNIDLEDLKLHDLGDAHLDLRNEFMGLKLSHTTFMRRINEEMKPAKIIEVGTRAVCKEELDYAEKAGIEFFTAKQIREEGSNQIAKQLMEKLAKYENIYLSIDMDFLDPAYAPAVQNPEPDGLEMHILLDILSIICDKRLVSFDVVEVAPNYDQGVSAIQAARLIFEILCYIEKSRKL